MTTKNRQILTAIIGIILLIGLGAASLIVIPRLTTTRESVAPTAPESRPAAAEQWLGGASCNLSFSIAAVEQPGVCQRIVFLTQDAAGNWVDTEGSEVPNKLKLNDKVRTAVVASGSAIAKARFKMNDGQWLVTTNKDAAGRYYSEFTVSTYRTYNFEGQIATAAASTEEGWIGSTSCRASFTLVAGATPTPSPTLTPTPTIIASCNQGCDSDNDCSAGLICDETSGACRNASCTTATNCRCVVATPTPSAPRPTPTPTTAQLPEAGIGLPTLGALGGGVVMILLGILLAL